MATKRIPRAAPLRKSESVTRATLGESNRASELPAAMESTVHDTSQITALSPSSPPAPIDLAVFDFKLEPGDARETSDGKIACVAQVEARLLDWFLPIWELSARHLRNVDRRLFNSITIDTMLPSCDNFRFIVRWQPTSPPTDLQIAATKATAGKTLLELTETLQACRSATPSDGLGTENSLARKVQRHIACTPLSFEPEFQLTITGHDPAAPVKLAPRQALPWVCVDQDSDKAILMKPLRLHPAGGRIAAVLSDGTPFDGTFGDTEHLSLQLATLVGHWIMVTGQLELDQKPLSTSQRLAGSISKITGVANAWHMVRLPAVREALEVIAKLSTFDPPAFDPLAGTLFEEPPVEDKT